LSDSLLSKKQCIPCEGRIEKLRVGQVAELHEQVPDWELVDQHHLHRQFIFEDFAQALDFTNRVGALAEEEFHHPEITLTWGRVDLRIWTHAIGGLSENDFILAAKCDGL
jgi:4a-hydroxytetrahydrobiopterin dehydratase